MDVYSVIFLLVMIVWVIGYIKVVNEMLNTEDETTEELRFSLESLKYSCHNALIYILALSCLAIIIFILTPIYIVVDIYTVIDIFLFKIRIKRKIKKTVKRANKENGTDIKIVDIEVFIKEDEEEK